MKRGDLVTVAMQGAMGKPRPALVVQAEPDAPLSTVVVLPITSDATQPIALIRLTMEPTTQNGLRVPSQVMIDKIAARPRDKIGPVFGHVDDTTMLEVSRALAVFLGIAG